LSTLELKDTLYNILSNVIHMVQTSSPCLVKESEHHWWHIMLKNLNERTINLKYELRVSCLYLAHTDGPVLYIWKNNTKALTWREIIIL